MVGREGGMVEDGGVMVRERGRGWDGDGDGNMRYYSMSEYSANISYRGRTAPD